MNFRALSHKKSSFRVGSFGLLAVWKEGKNLKSIQAWEKASQYIRVCYRNIIAAPLTFLLTLVTVSLSLFILAGFIWTYEQAKISIQKVGHNMVLSIYIKDGVLPQEIMSLKTELQSDANVDKVDLIDKSRALTDFERALGNSFSLLDDFKDQNPLPVSLEVTFKEVSLSVFERFVERYRPHPVVEVLHYSGGLLGQFVTVWSAFRIMGLGLVILLIFISGFIISNTIRLALYAHREEIAIMGLVGARESYIKTPYLIEGVLQGVLGGFFSIGAVYLCSIFANKALKNSPLASLIVPHLEPLSYGAMILVIVVGVLVGLSGSYFAAKKFSRS